MSELRQSPDDLCVVGLGAATSIGESAAASAAAARAGVAGFKDHAFMTDEVGEPFVVASAPYLDDFLPCNERLTSLARMACLECLAPLGELNQRSLRGVPLFLGLPSPRPGLADDFEEKLCDRLRNALGDLNSLAALQTNREGHCGGFVAIEAAAQALRDDAADFCLAGGVDSYLDPETLDWIDVTQQLHNTVNPFGFVPGEAAACTLLCLRSTAERFQLAIMGQLVTIGQAREENLIHTESVCTGRGLTDAFRLALEPLPDGTLVQDMICDQNGEPYRAEELGFTWIRTNQHFSESLEFQSPADCWGDVGAASASLFVALASMAACKGYAAGPHTLLWTSALAGRRTAAVFQAESNGSHATN